VAFQRRSDAPLPPSASLSPCLTCHRGSCQPVGLNLSQHGIRAAADCLCRQNATVETPAHGCISVSMADDIPTRCSAVTRPALSRWERPRQNSSALSTPLSTSCSYSLFRSLKHAKEERMSGHRKHSQGVPASSQHWCSCVDEHLAQRDTLKGTHASSFSSFAFRSACASGPFGVPTAARGSSGARVSTTCTQGCALSHRKLDLGHVATTC
jgi:hypothetical protein